MSEQKFSISIHAKLKHGFLWDALQRRGWNQSQGARFLGMSTGDFGRWVNLKHRPHRFSKDRERRLFELTGKTIEELWPPEIFSKEFMALPKALSVTRDVPVQALLGSSALALPTSEVLERNELKRLVAEALDQLSSKQARVVRAHLFEGLAFEKIGIQLQISGSRAAQIYQGAIRRLQHPAHCKKFKPWVGMDT